LSRTTNCPATQADCPTLAEQRSLTPSRPFEAEPAKFERAALRWHARFVTEASPSLLRAQIALAALAELRAGSEPAKKVLVDLSSVR
jgi:hypothetical protein